MTTHMHDAVVADMRWMIRSICRRIALNAVREWTEAKIMDDYYITKREAYEALRDKLAYSVRGPLLPSQAHLIAKIISDIPAADVVEAVHARWVNGRTVLESVVCSNCKTAYQAYYSDYQYCPRCGAQMDGGESE